MKSLRGRRDKVSRQSGLSRRRRRATYEREGNRAGQPQQNWKGSRTCEPKHRHTMDLRHLEACVRRGREEVSSRVGVVFSEAAYGLRSSADIQCSSQTKTWSQDLITSPFCGQKSKEVSEPFPSGGQSGDWAFADCHEREATDREGVRFVRRAQLSRNCVTGDISNNEHESERKAEADRQGLV